MAETNNHDHHTHISQDTPSPISADFPIASAGIVMLSAPDSQDADIDNGVPQEVFHTPPDKSSLPSDDDQPRTTNAGVDHCAVNHAVDVGAGTEGFVNFCDGSETVDLGRDSELGFSEVQLTQETDAAEGSHGARGGVLGDVRDCQIDECGGFKRGVTDSGESPAKKLKLSEQDLGFDSSGDCLGVQLQKVEVGTGNCKGKMVCESDGGVNLCESEKLGCTVEGNVSSDGVVEGSGMLERSDEGPGRRVLPSSTCRRLENAAERGNGGEKKKKDVFDVLKALSEISHDDDDDDDDDDDNLSLFEVAKACGMTFPRPRWWPDDDDNFNPPEWSV